MRVDDLQSGDLLLAKHASVDEKSLNYLIQYRDPPVQMLCQGKTGVKFQNVKFEKLYETPKCRRI